MQGEHCDQHVLHHNSVGRLIKKFYETGSVDDAEQSGRLSKETKQRLLDITDPRDLYEWPLQNSKLVVGWKQQELYCGDYILRRDN